MPYLKDSLELFWNKVLSVKFRCYEIESIQSFNGETTTVVFILMI